jgi:transcriptional regulator with XRE-family HTH domain
MTTLPDGPSHRRLDDPAVQRRRLKVELRRLRLAADQTQESVARAMDWSKSKLIRIEGGETRITRNDLKVLLGYYGVTDPARIDSLIEAARVAREDRWATYRDVHTPAFLRYLDYESSAALIRGYEDHFVPGLLQVEEYCLELQRAVYGSATDEAERRWSVRLQRQRMHDRDQPPRMRFIIDESVVRRPVGGPAVMTAQLQALVAHSQSSHVSVQILPIEAGATPGLTGSFVLLEFEDPGDDPVLYIEHDSKTTREAPDETTHFLERFLNLEDVALSPDDSVSLFTDEIERLNSSRSGLGSSPSPG